MRLGYCGTFPFGRQEVTEMSKKEWVGRGNRGSPVIQRAGERRVFLESEVINPGKYPRRRVEDESWWLNCRKSSLAFWSMISAERWEWNQNCRKIVKSLMLSRKCEADEGNLMTVHSQGKIFRSRNDLSYRPEGMFQEKRKHTEIIIDGMRSPRMWAKMKWRTEVEEIILGNRIHLNLRLKERRKKFEVEKRKDVGKNPNASAF